MASVGRSAMRLLPKFALVATLLVGLVSLVLWLPTEAEVPLPRLPAHPLLESAAGPKAVVDATGWAGPWAQPPVVRTVVAPTPIPTSAPIPPPVPVDGNSVRYLGTMEDAAGRTIYLFKYLPVNRALSLVQGVPTEGWTLDKVTGHEFSLTGPGGLYAATR
jgi:hypothetical protein